MQFGYVGYHGHQEYLFLRSERLSKDANSQKKSLSSYHRPIAIYTPKSRPDSFNNKSVKAGSPIKQEWMYGTYHNPKGPYSSLIQTVHHCMLSGYKFGH